MHTALIALFFNTMHTTQSTAAVERMIHHNLSQIQTLIAQKHLMHIFTKSQNMASSCDILQAPLTSLPLWLLHQKYYIQIQKNVVLAVICTYLM